MVFFGEPASLMRYLGVFLIAVQKKAMEIQEQTAAQLIWAIPPQPNPAVNPPNLGQNVDDFA